MARPEGQSISNNSTQHQFATHNTPSPFQQVIKIPAGMFKTVLDAWNGYHSILLAESARDFFTFLCSQGRFRYLRCPQGFHGSGDVYTHHFDEITRGFSDKIRQIDDTLLWKDTIEKMFWHVINYIHHCTRNGIIFNPKKFTFCKMVIEFSGFLVTGNSIKPSPRIVDAILKFPTPKNLTGIRSWFGLVNQVSYAFAQTELMSPFRELLKHNKKFYWDATLEKLFQETKTKIVEQIEHGIRTFDCKKASCLSTDWSKTGIGFFLFQQSCSCQPIEGPNCGGGHWAVVFAGSRFTTDAESRYAPIEGEALAVVYSLESSKVFVIGCPNLIIAVDHKPLLKILSNQQPLDEIKNPRLQRFKERAMRYQFRIKHTPGNKNLCADAASRYPVKQPTEESEANSVEETTTFEESSICSALHHVTEDAPEEETDIELSVIHETMSLFSDSVQLKAVTWSRIKAAARQDKVCCDLVNIISSGFPHHKKELPEHLRPFWAMRDTLYSVDGVPINDKRILIPQQLRKEVLECLHSAHQGATGMREHAKHRLFWPGLDAALCLTRAQCSDCNSRAPAQSEEPLLICAAPEFPFQSTATDLFHCQGHKFLLYVDRFTAWLEIALTPKSDAANVINNLRRWFTTFGVPMELASDGGPPFDSITYTTFLKNWGIVKRQSSAYFPRSNGRAELGVKSGKRLLMANLDSTGSLDRDAISRALLTYRNTPIQNCSVSPAELLYGRKLNDHLPLPPFQQLEVLPKWKEIRQAREAMLSSRIAERADKSWSSHNPLKPLSPGQHVLIQDEGKTPARWNRSGLVTEVLPFRQYRVKYDGSGRLQVRNRQHLKAFVPPSAGPSYPPTPTTLIPNEDVTISTPALASTPIRSVRATIHPSSPPTWRASPASNPSNNNNIPYHSVSHLPPNNSTQDDSTITIVPDTQQSPQDQDLSSTIPYDITQPEPVGLRRSTRTRNAPPRLSPKLRGKSHIRN